MRGGAGPRVQADMLQLPLTLITAPVSVLDVDTDYVNEHLVEWGHKLGPCRRPFGSQGWAMLVDGEPVSVALSCSTVGKSAGPYNRFEIVELARLCSSNGWANRVMLRLWRECLAQRWPHWEVRAAVSYQLAIQHTGNLYRFDGWTKVAENCGSGGGGTWSSTRPDGALVKQSKNLWAWEF